MRKVTVRRSVLAFPKSVASHSRGSFGMSVTTGAGAFGGVGAGAGFGVLWMIGAGFVTSGGFSAFRKLFVIGSAPFST
jgi:hypothetical protein